ncbi:hypothetical protein PIB30_067067 [Stylosanthes scabra]|uniref:SWIM-type domain-containing protein n=1 Tax=Stylosanthes scabra TaxID=79078 RepID=A0ABU6YPC3_9FABA|nr:hypothetical protein [Stylosanthes scabra]
MRAMEKNMRDSRSFAVTQFDRHSSEFEVTQISPTGGFSLGSYRVSLRERRCDCGSFQALHYSCMHAVACCAHTRVNWTTYVHDVYKMSFADDSTHMHAYAWKSTHMRAAHTPTHA